MSQDFELDFYEESHQYLWWKILPSYIKKIYLDCDLNLSCVYRRVWTIFARLF